MLLPAPAGPVSRQRPFCWRDAAPQAALGGSRARRSGSRPRAADRWRTDRARGRSARDVPRSLLLDEGNLLLALRAARARGGGGGGAGGGARRLLLGLRPTSAAVISATCVSSSASSSVGARRRRPSGPRRTRSVSASAPLACGLGPVGRRLSLIRSSKDSNASPSLSASPVVVGLARRGRRGARATSQNVGVDGGDRLPRRARARLVALRARRRGRGRSAAPSAGRRAGRAARAPARGAPRRRRRARGRARRGPSCGGTGACGSGASSATRNSPIASSKRPISLYAMPRSKRASKSCAPSCFSTPALKAAKTCWKPSSSVPPGRAGRPRRALVEGVGELGGEIEVAALGPPAARTRRAAAAAGRGGRGRRGRRHGLGAASSPGRRLRPRLRRSGRRLGAGAGARHRLHGAHLTGAVARRPRPRRRWRLASAFFALLSRRRARPRPRRGAAAPSDGSGATSRSRRQTVVAPRRACPGVRKSSASVETLETSCGVVDELPAVGAAPRLAPRPRLRLRLGARLRRGGGSRRPSPPRATALVRSVDVDLELEILARGGRGAASGSRGVGSLRRSGSSTSVESALAPAAHGPPAAWCRGRPRISERTSSASTSSSASSAIPASVRRRRCRRSGLLPRRRRAASSCASSSSISISRSSSASRSSGPSPAGFAPRAERLGHGGIELGRRCVRIRLDGRGVALGEGQLRGAAPGLDRVVALLRGGARLAELLERAAVRRARARAGRAGSRSRARACRSGGRRSPRRGAARRRPPARPRPRRRTRPTSRGVGAIRRHRASLSSRNVASSLSSLARPRSAAAAAASKGVRGGRSCAGRRPRRAPRAAARESPSREPASLMKPASSIGVSPKFIPLPPIAASRSAASMTAASLTSAGASRRR